MIVLYRKTNKSIDNLSGYEEIKEGENPFTKPCFLCISAQTRVDKSVFGLAKVGASLARVRVRNHYNGGFDIDQMPVSFLATRLSDDEEEIKLFIETYFIPLIYKNGKKASLEDACKAFRNINMLTYCDGTFKSVVMEKCLIKRLSQMGYTTQEINQILSQIAVIPIATDKDQSLEKMSVISFKDLGDFEVLDQRDAPYYEGKESEYMLDVAGNLHRYLFKGNGEHELNAYTYESLVSAYASLAVTSILENSVRNANNPDFVPLDVSEIFMKLKEVVRMGLSRIQVLDQIDRNVSYGGIPRITRREALLLDKFDVSCDIIKRDLRELEFAKKASEEKSKKLSDMQQSVERNCSSTTALRILLESVGWQVSKEQLEQIMSTPTDKEVVESLDNGMKK